MEFLKISLLRKLGINGFTTTYLFPAVSTTTQIIGRLLRDLDRYRKVAVLLDGRFYRYRRYMPKWLVSRMKPVRLFQFLNTSIWR
ncbi:helicase C-terminal domain-containing protein [Vulcanisaeta distributa]|uniref:helicase C-terminal domain-containing protein n=1 Tax=Vulcanisaeta distributa TaxID=164451 RepID=UPI001FB25A20|nr:helicase C-terminal domain-containing protein [Vulcanisaeta distributa]